MFFWSVHTLTLKIRLQVNGSPFQRLQLVANFTQISQILKNIVKTLRTRPKNHVSRGPLDGIPFQQTKSPIDFKRQSANWIRIRRIAPDHSQLIE